MTSAIVPPQVLFVYCRGQGLCGSLANPPPAHTHVECEPKVRPRSVRAHVGPSRLGFEPFLRDTGSVPKNLASCSVRLPTRGRNCSSNLRRDALASALGRRRVGLLAMSAIGTSRTS